MTRVANESAARAGHGSGRFMTPLLQLLVVCAAVSGAVEARAQNDWQFPDPYFGILEIEKSRPPVDHRPGVAATPAPRRPMQRPRVLRARRRHALQNSRP